jgi:RNA polymerase-binding transcription factor DksA
MIFRSAQGARSTRGAVPSPSVAAVPDQERTRLLDAIEVDLADVELALARLEAGTYETCEVCATELGDDVLSVTPTIRRCPTCTDAAI